MMVPTWNAPREPAAGSGELFSEAAGNRSARQLTEAHSEGLAGGGGRERKECGGRDARRDEGRWWKSKLA